MPSRKIILEKNKYYHIFNRWFNKNIIFRNNSDFERFIAIIVKYNKIYDWIKILAYSILPNHFHIILITNKENSDISNFVWKIQQSYLMYFKTKYKDKYLEIKWKTFFEWNFKIKYINSEEYLKQCISYVIYNSIHHKIVKNIEDYKWSSYHLLKNKDKINNYKDLILNELEI